MRIVLLAALGIGLVACTPVIGGQVQPTNPAVSASSVNPTSTAIPATHIPSLPTSTSTPAPPEPPEPLTRYTLSAVLDYDAHRLTVDEKVAYVNHTGSDLNELLLLVEPNRYFAGFTLRSLAWEEGESITGYTLSGVELRIPLPTPLPPGESAVITLTYEALLPNQNAPYGYTQRQTNLGDWYPYVPPYTPGEGWLVRQDAFYGEHLAYEVAAFDVEIRLARPTSANGGLLTVAASSLPQGGGEGGILRYRHEPARNFAWTVSDQYQMQEASVGDITLMSYAFPFHPLADGPALEETARALALFNDLFSPYPHQALSVVEADFLDGMEFDGLIFLSHAFYDYYTGDQKSNLTIIAAHEVAHQWWYGYVANDQAMEPWLDEALSTFSERYFYENVYPELADWYWENRVTIHSPQGWMDSTIYEAAGFYPYRDAVYLRGAMFLAELRELMGEDAFLEFLRDYLRKYSYRLATGDDFFALLSEHTQADLRGLLDAYLLNR